MTQSANISLYDLLPAIYRKQDENNNGALRYLFTIFEQEFAKIQQEITTAYDNIFIETCEPWIEPFIGDLLGIHKLREKQAILPYLRSYIANSIQYRNNKGQKATLESAIKDTTHWHARVVEYAPLLNAMQTIHAVRPSQGKLVDIRDSQNVQTINTPFDSNAHTVDVRSAERYPAKYNIHNLGVFIWRLKSYQMLGCTAKLLSEYLGGYTFDPAGIDIPLFNHPVSVTSDFMEINTPSPIRLSALKYDLATSNANYYGAQRSLYINKIYTTGQVIPVEPNEIIAMNLSDWNSKVPENKVAIDPCLGRFILGKQHLSNLVRVEVNYCYGSTPDLGAGIYDSEDALNKINITAGSSQSITISQQDDLSTIIQQVLQNNTFQETLQITITDNATYTLDQTIITANNNLRNFIIQAANGCRPCLHLANNLQLNGVSNPLIIHLNGLYIDGTVELRGNIQLEISQCTFVPKNNLPSLQTGTVDNSSCITIKNSVMGALYLSANMAALHITDSIIDGLQNTAIAANTDASLPGPFTSIERSTIFGSIHVVEIDQISESVITELVNVDRIQYGCVRYSYLPLTSSTPPRFNCQPDFTINVLAQEYISANGLSFRSSAELANNNSAWYTATLNNLQPVFTSTQFGHPQYGQLEPQTNSGVLRGAENNLEMGVFNYLGKPERNEILQEVIEEYLPFNLEGRVFFVT